MKTKKTKRSSPKLEMFFPRNQVKTKKKVFTAIWDYIRPKFVGFIRAGWLLIVSSSSAQISMGGRLNLDGGTLNLDGGTLTLDGGTRPPALPLQFKYWLYAEHTEFTQDSLPCLLIYYDECILIKFMMKQHRINYHNDYNNQ